MSPSRLTEGPARQQAEADGILGLQPPCASRPPGSSAGRDSSRGPCGSPPCAASRPNRGGADRARCRSGAAGCGCRWRSDRRAVLLGPQAAPARHSPGSCRRRCRPRPARHWAGPRARAARRPGRRPRAQSPWVGRASAMLAPAETIWAEPQARLARLDRQARRAVARAAAPPIAAGSSRHRGRRPAASCLPRQVDAQARPARHRPTRHSPRAMARRGLRRARARPAPPCPRARRAARSRPAAGRRPLLPASPAAARSSASQRPRGVGRQNLAGRTKAKSSRSIERRQVVQAKAAPPPPARGRRAAGWRPRASQRRRPSAARLVCAVRPAPKRAARGRDQGGAGAKTTPSTAG